MTFFSLDVETANPDQSTICQVGIGVFENGKLTGSWKSYIDPQDYFHRRFMDIHGIRPEMVRRKPTFPDVYLRIRSMFENNIVVHHSPFDRIAFTKAFNKYGLQEFGMNWVDSVKVAQEAWQNLEGGYNLANLAKYLDIEFRHHDALEDAIACGKIVLYACRKSGKHISEYIKSR